MTAAPEPGAQDLAEKVARAHHAANYQAKGGWPSWDDSPSPYRSDMLRSAGQWLDASRAAGLAVVELPGPDRWTKDGDSNQPEWETCCETLTAWPQGVETEDGLVDATNLDTLRAPALKVLAACDAADRLRAEHGGDPR
jgi:hypothetical protein